ncbi:type IV pilus assembly protein PilN [Kushneria sinocarnis]|uniref:Type IV pilus assembly protein PilN n=1 Tax=Kushneria sinocarnis TaxID=595502 RepID=A0A420WXB1_9GAMM|nr:PilN domain-containing protein [Kushneria sinocarnis]RKR04401.1 type IV pilus assembly protein PilN [Kushneria sinocarnis]
MKRSDDVGAAHELLGISINLLPWRARQRERHNRIFLLVVVACALLGGGIGWGRAALVGHQLQLEQARLAHIRDSMTRLQQDIASVQSLQARREQLQGRIALIRRLEFSRPYTVMIYNALTATLVDGVHFDRVARHGEQLEISGLAGSNRQVSEQLRRLAGSDIFGEPQLQDVRADDKTPRMRRFNLMLPVNTGEPAIRAGEEASS